MHFQNEKLISFQVLAKRFDSRVATEPSFIKTNNFNLFPASNHVVSVIVLLPFIYSYFFRLENQFSTYSTLRYIGLAGKWTYERNWNDMRTVLPFDDDRRMHSKRRKTVDKNVLNSSNPYVTQMPLFRNTTMLWQDWVRFWMREIFQQNYSSQTGWTLRTAH